MKLLLFALLSALCLLRIPSVVKVAESRASWVASMFGLAALYVLGTVTPLAAIDSYLGGVNVTNLLQAIFALLAIFFFNDSVRRLANGCIRYLAARSTPPKSRSGKLATTRAAARP